ncbi:MAG: beta strand repeat-containing protein [Hyphomicrobiales bacterium]
MTSGYKAKDDRLVAIGFDALRDAKGTGTNTHADGTVYNNGATDSVGIGTSALKNSTGKENAGIGFRAGFGITGDGNLAIGLDANSGSVTADKSTALGANTVASADRATAIGASAEVTAKDAMAIGAGAKSTHAGSTAIGLGAATTLANQILLGTATTPVNVPHATATKNTTTGKIAVIDANGNLNHAELDGSSIINDNGTIKVDYTDTSANIDGNGLVQNGSELDVNAGDGIEIVSDKVQAKLETNGGVEIGAGGGLQINAQDTVNKITGDTTAITNLTGGVVTNITGNLTNRTNLATALVDRALSVGADGKIDVNVDGSTINVNGSNELFVDTAVVGGGLAGNGLEYNAATKAIDVTAGDGIDTSGDDVAVVAGNGISVDGTGVHAAAAAGGGLKVDGTGISIDQATIGDNVSVAIDGTGDAAAETFTYNKATGEFSGKITLQDDKVMAKHINADVAGTGITQNAATGALEVDLSSVGGGLAGNGLEYNAATKSIDVTAGNERLVTNVADGRITATSTDAVNGSQLYQVASVVDTLSANGCDIGAQAGGLGFECGIGGNGYFQRIR